MTDDSNHVYAISEGPCALFELFRTLDVPPDAKICFYLNGITWPANNITCERSDITWFSNGKAEYALVGTYGDWFGSVTAIELSNVTHVDIRWDKRNECHA